MLKILQDGLIDTLSDKTKMEKAVLSGR